MKLNIFLDGEPVEVKTLVPPKQINENLIKLNDLFPHLVENIKKVDFLTKYITNE